MFKKISMAAAAAAMIMSAGAASAANVSVSGGGTAVTLTANADVYQSQQLSCTNTYSATVVNNGSADYLTVATSGQTLGSGSSLCNNVTLTSNWRVDTGTYSAGTAPLTVTNINANSLAGTCTQGSATVTGTWHNGAPGYGEVAGTIPGVILWFSSPCTLDVRITSSGDLTVS